MTPMHDQLLTDHEDPPGGGLPLDPTFGLRVAALAGMITTSAAAPAAISELNGLFTDSYQLISASSIMGGTI